MTKQQAREAAAIMLAWADGKEVEYSLRGHDNWEPNEAPCWSWYVCEYRIKPTTTLRPWTADEVPLGAQVRSRSYHPDHRSMIIQSGNPILREGWLNDYEHSTDGGKTWLPCGVMEEAK